MTDEECMAMCRKGESQAFRIIVERHWRRLLWRMRTLVKDNASAEELVADTFVALLRYVPDWNDESRVKPLLDCIAHRNALMHLRKQARSPLQLGIQNDISADALADINGDGDPETMTLLAEDLTLIESLVKTRPALEQQIFRRHFAEHQSYEEIATHLGSSVGAVRAWISRTRGAIRRALMETGDQVEAGDQMPPQTKGRL